MNNFLIFQNYNQRNSDTHTLRETGREMNQSVIEASIHAHTLKLSHTDRVFLFFTAAPVPITSDERVNSFTEQSLLFVTQ